MKIGVLGVGVVGGAVKECFSKFYTVKAFDIAKQYDTLDDVKACDLIFVCVNTPTTDGTQDLSQLKSACKSLRGTEGVVVIKCTVLPGTCQKLAEMYGLTIVHNPEFLTERNAVEDFKRQTSILLSGPADATIVVAAAHALPFPDAEITCFSDYGYTELVKYFHNVFLAIKVAFCNEIYSVCETLGLDYTQVRDQAAALGGIGMGHTAVPGPDGKFGFSGMCFPKDTRAFLDFMQRSNLRCDTLLGAVISNDAVRPHDHLCKEAG